MLTLGRTPPVASTRVPSTVDVIVWTLAAKIVKKVIVRRDRHRSDARNTMVNVAYERDEAPVGRRVKCLGYGQSRLRSPMNRRNAGNSTRVDVFTIYPGTMRGR